MNTMMQTARKNPPLLLAAFALTCSLLATPSPAEDDAAQLDRTFPRTTLQIATPDARLHSFKMWVAADDARRARGLMYVRKLADDEGMLFIYPSEQPVAMWMKNTYIPLDMLFVAADGRIVRVAENTTPHSLATIESKRPVLGVIELNAGAAARLKIGVGARVQHAAFSASNAAKR